MDVLVDCMDSILLWSYSYVHVGMKDNATSTSSFNIFPNCNYLKPSNTAGATVIGFTVTNTIQIQHKYQQYTKMDWYLYRCRCK